MNGKAHSTFLSLSIHSFMKIPSPLVSRSQHVNTISAWVTSERKGWGSPVGFVNPCSQQTKRWYISIIQIGECQCIDDKKHIQCEKGREKSDITKDRTTIGDSRRLPDFNWTLKGLTVIKLHLKLTLKTDQGLENVIRVLFWSKHFKFTNTRTPLIKHETQLTTSVAC